MVALDAIKPHLTPDFVAAFKKLGRQVGYSKLGRAIAYMQLPTEAAVESISSVSRNDNGDKVAVVKYWPKLKLAQQFFTPCEVHKADWERLYESAPVGHAPQLWVGCVNYANDHLSDGRVGCDGCTEASLRVARASVEAHVDARKLPTPHSANKWWYQETCPHNGWGKPGDCERCGKNQLAAWVKACGSP